MSQGFERWLGMMETGSHDGLWDLLDPDCVFWSPVVHTPQQGRPVSHAYLSAAGAVFNSGFRYTRQVVDGEHGVFEFECEIDGIHINGIDMITMRDGRIVASDTLAQLGSGATSIRLTVARPDEGLLAGLQAIEGVEEARREAEGRYRVHARSDVREQVAAVAVAHGLLELSGQQGLEEVYLQLTGGAS